MEIYIVTKTDSTKHTTVLKTFKNADLAFAYMYSTWQMYENVGEKVIMDVHFSKIED